MYGLKMNLVSYESLVFLNFLFGPLNPQTFFAVLGQGQRPQMGKDGASVSPDASSADDDDEVHILGTVVWTCVYLRVYIDVSL